MGLGNQEDDHSHDDLVGAFLVLGLYRSHGQMLVNLTIGLLSLNWLCGLESYWDDYWTCVEIVVRADK